MFLYEWEFAKKGNRKTTKDKENVKWREIIKEFLWDIEVFSSYHSWRTVVNNIYIDHNLH